MTAPGLAPRAEWRLSCLSAAAGRSGHRAVNERLDAIGVPVRAMRRSQGRTNVRQSICPACTARIEDETIAASDATNAQRARYEALLRIGRTSPGRSRVGRRMIRCSWTTVCISSARAAGSARTSCTTSPIAGTKSRSRFPTSTPSCENCHRKEIDDTDLSRPSKPLQPRALSPPLRSEAADVGQCDVVRRRQPQGHAAVFLSACAGLQPRAASSWLCRGGPLGRLLVGLVLVVDRAALLAARFRLLRRALAKTSIRFTTLVARPAFGLPVLSISSPLARASIIASTSSLYLSWNCSGSN